MGYLLQWYDQGQRSMTSPLPYDEIATLFLVRGKNFGSYRSGNAWRLWPSSSDCYGLAVQPHNLRVGTTRVGSKRQSALLIPDLHRPRADIGRPPKTSNGDEPWCPPNHFYSNPYHAVMVTSLTWTTPGKSHNL